jgi:hypothetical protein
MNSPLCQRDLLVILAAAAAMGGLAQRELLPGQRVEFTSDRIVERSSRDTDPVGEFKNQILGRSQLENLSGLQKSH